MVGLLLTMVGDAGRVGYQHLVHRFWSSAKLSRIPLYRAMPVDGTAFCKARAKLGWEVIQTLFEGVAATFTQRFGSKLLWKGRRLLAADGAKFTLPWHRSLTRSFGKSKGAVRPMMAAVSIFDVLARVTLGVAFDRYASGERPLLTSILGRIPVGSVLLLDRGFPSFVLMSELASRGIDFVARAQRSFGAVKRFLETGRVTDTITLTAPKGPRPAHLPEKIKVRIERLQGDKGELLMFTSLSRQTASRRELLDLYRSRWKIETEFNVLKVTAFGEDSFHSHSANGIKQEVCARLLFLNLARCLLAEAAVRAGRPITSLAPKGAQAMLAQTEVVLVLIFRGPQTTRFLPFVLTVIARSPAEKRTGRHFPRVSHKPSPKWGSKGRKNPRNAWTG